MARPPSRLTTHIQHSHAAPVQRVHLFSGPLSQLRHKLRYTSLNQRLHLLQYRWGEDVCDTLLPLAVPLGVLHLEHAYPAKVIIRWRLDAAAADAIDGLDARQRAIGELVGCLSVHCAVLSVHGVDGAPAVTSEINHKDPFR